MRSQGSQIRSMVYALAAAVQVVHSFLIFSCVGPFRTIGGIETMTD